MVDKAEYNENNRLSWIDKDLKKLQKEELTKQLEVLFGVDEADRLTNPKLEGKSPSKFDKRNWNIYKSAYQQGAHVLWNNLRSNSRKKLARESKDLNNDYVNHRLIDWHSSSEHVERYKQRVELMHKVSRFNESKTKQLLQIVKLPSISDDSDSVKSAFTDQLKEKTYQSDSKQYASSHWIKSHPIVSSPTKTDRRVTFLSEKDCETTGRFCKRIEKLRLKSNIGVSMPEPYRGSNKKHYTQPEPVIHKSKHPPKSKIELTTSNTNDSAGLSSNQSWQPLTMNALSEYAYSIPGPGSGEYSRGSVKMWKPSSVLITNKKT